MIAGRGQTIVALGALSNQSREGGNVASSSGREGAEGGVFPPGGRSKWALVRQAVFSGQVRALLLNKRYSVVTATFKRLFPHDFDRAIPVIRHHHVDRLLSTLDSHMGDYERAKQSYQQSGKRPRCYWGLLCGGDLIDYHRSRGGPPSSALGGVHIKALQQEINDARNHALVNEATPSWFVFFRTQSAATIAASVPIHAEDNREFKVHPAPGPEEVNWPTLWLNYRQRDWRHNLVRPLILIVLLLPVGIFTSGMQQLDFVFCPVHRCANAQCWSLSEMDICIAKYLFQFSVFTVFLGGVLGSAIVQQVNISLEKGPSEMLELFGTFLPASSNFFLNYLLLRTLVSIPLKLVLPHPGVRMYLLRRYFRCSPVLTVRDRAVLYAPVSPRYGFEIGRMMLMYVIGLAFALVSPLLMPLVVLFFFMHGLFWRYSLLYVYVRKYESGGLMWPFVFERIIYSYLICTLFTACVFVAKQAYAPALILFFTVPFILYRFHRFCFFRYQKGLATMPLEYAAAAPPSTVDPWVYIPPPLREKAFGWHPEWSVPWEGWGLPRSYGIAP
eukprot:gene17208-23528_t